MNAEIIRTPDALATLEEEWWRLFHQTPALTPFSSPAWLLPWWQVFAPGALCSVAVRNGGDLVALAPLYLEDGPYGRRLLPIGIGVSDYTDILLHPAHTDAAHAVFAALGQDSIRAEVWSAEELPPGSATLDLEPPEGWTVEGRPASPCPVLAFPDKGFSAEVVPQRQRRKWRMAQHRAARRQGRLRPATAATMMSDLEHLERLHAARWEERGEAGVLATDPVQRFHQAAVPRLFAAGLLRMISLDFGDDVGGVYYGLCHRERAYAYLMGFDPRFAFESPGTIVLGAALEAAAADGCTEFHFLRGQESYKYGWGSMDRWNTCREFRSDP